MECTFPSVSRDTGAKPRVGHPLGTAPETLAFEDVVTGDGPEVKAGDVAIVQYVGALYDGGQEFDDTWHRGIPFAFELAAGEVIEGFEVGIPGMRLGGRRIIVIPAPWGYGAEGAPPEIPPNATLVFVVDLVGVEPGRRGG